MLKVYKECIMAAMMYKLKTWKNKITWKQNLKWKTNEQSHAREKENGQYRLGIRDRDKLTHFFPPKWDT